MLRVAVQTIELAVSQLDSDNLGSEKGTEWCLEQSPLNARSAAREMRNAGKTRPHVSATQVREALRSRASGRMP